MAIITIAFDDCFADTIEMCGPFLKDNGVRATFAAVTDFTGLYRKGDRIAGKPDLISLSNDGHEIASHGRSHRNLMDVFASGGETAVREELDCSQKALEDLLGRSVTSFVFPYIENNNNARLRGLAAEYYSSSRITSEKNFLNALPPKDPYSITGVAATSGAPIKTLERLVEKTVGRDVWLIEVFHLVSRKNTESPERKTPYGFFTRIDEFKDHVEYILSRNIPVMTQKEVIQKF
jgi:peptidoglycan/xylan/chitin deacetylase (PgdA/CDA1 family)